MMGFDSYGYGIASSSSSNLSPLAPPFTVDRTVLNLNSNPSVNNNFINEPPPLTFIAPPPPPLPSYSRPAPPPPLPYSAAGTYNSSIPSWGLPSNPTSMADYYTTFNSPADSVSTLDKYLSSIPPLNMSASDESGAFSHAPYTDSVKTAANVAKPYYPPYVSPSIEEKESLGGLGDSTYDFLSTCCLAPSGGTSQGDHTKKVSGWGSLNRWDNSWNGFKDLDSGKCTDSKWDSSFYSNEKNVLGSTLCMDYVKPGATKYDEVKRSSNALFPAIGTLYSQLNMDLSRQNEEFSSKRDLGVDYPRLTLNSNKYEVGDNCSRYSLYPENIGRDDANTSLTGPLLSDISLSKASEPHFPQTSSPNRFSLKLDEIKVNDSFDTSKNLDPYNPAEDSPCWKGASSSQFSCFEGSHASAPKPLPEKAPYVIDGSQELGESFTCNPSKAIENSLSPPRKRSTFSTYSYEGRGDKFTSTQPGTSFPEQNCNWIFASPIKSHLEDASLTSEKSASRSCLVDKENNDSECSVMGSLHVPNHNTDDDISKLPSLKGEKSAPKIDFAALIKTMHNLSDLLLFHCSNDESAINEQEKVALKHVIGNLNSCMSKIPPSTLKRKAVFSANPCQDANATEIAAASDIDNVDNHLADAKETRNVLPCIEDEECHDFCNVHNASEIGKPDEMTQAIKKVLTKKFNGEEERLPQALLYKNLWLEAEAVICSTNFKARFDRVKNEMEKNNPLEVKDGFQGMINMEKLSHPEVDPEVKLVNNLNSDLTSSIQNFPMISKTSPAVLISYDKQGMVDMEKFSHPEVYPEVKLVNNLNSDLTSSIQNSPKISKTSPADDVMARFRVLKSRGDKSTSMSDIDTVKDVSSNYASDAKNSVPDSPNISTTNHVDDVVARFRILTSRGDSSASMSTTHTMMHLISSLSPAQNEVNALASDTCIQGSPLSSKIRCSNDADDAVMARLRILKCRADKNDETMDTGIGYDLQNPVDQCNEDKLNVNKTDLLTQEMSFESCDGEEVENQNSTGWYDGPSLDWEHVLKDDFAWQK